ncbi:MAG: hypothetical protein IMX04_09480 [Candidatus Carbobacillus altaicus]|nr:hypothetical protein [Candidatus Carbobacillus altaicus]
MVRRLLGQALFFYLVLSTLGTILRIKLVFPLFPKLPYNNVLHAHSHIAFLGWINVALIALMIFFTFPNQGASISSLKFFIGSLWVVNIGLVLSFLAQAYGPVSITFSTLSVVLSVWFLFLYFRHGRSSNISPLAKRFLSTGVIFYVASAIGLVMVALSMAAKIGGRGLFNAGVYFYLHSQYNGWMVFALIGTMLAASDRLHELHADQHVGQQINQHTGRHVNQYIKQQDDQPIGQHVKQHVGHHVVQHTDQTKQVKTTRERRLGLSWLLLTLGFLPSYIPQISFLDLPAWLNIIGILGTFSALAGILLFISEVTRSFRRSITQPALRLLFLYIMAALIVKFTLEAAGAFPMVAFMIQTNRPVIIGYLHLTLLVIFSSYIFFALYQYGFIRRCSNRPFKAFSRSRLQNQVQTYQSYSHPDATSAASEGSMTRFFMITYMILTFTMVFLLFVWGLWFWLGLTVNMYAINTVLAVISAVLSVLGFIPWYALRQSNN